MAPATINFRRSRLIGQPQIRLPVALITALLPIASLAAGPISYGPIRIGMDRGAVDALTEGEVRLAEPLKPWVRADGTAVPFSPDYGMTFSARLVTPISATPMLVLMSFKDGALTSFSLELEKDSKQLELLRSQITEKYGEPKVENTMKEERCLYQNGANFNISSGSIRQVWLQEVEGGRVETRLSENVYDMCPSTLSTRIPSLTTKWLVIRRQQRLADPAPPRNLF